MPLGIRPINDFAFKKTFGTPANKGVLVSLLNAILDLNSPIADVTIENPFNLQDFADDKLSVLDVKAVDQSGAIYDVEIQLTVVPGLDRRIVFYGCELYAGQLQAGEDYSELKPVYSICIADGILWRDARQVHHAFRLTDRESGRTLPNTLEIHTLELGRYNRTESELASAPMLDCWLYWLLHAHEYEPAELLRLLPQVEFQQATRTLTEIAEKTEDKTMYDAREKARRDQQWALTGSYREGFAHGELAGETRGEVRGLAIGEIRLIHALQNLLLEALTAESELQSKSLSELQAITAELQERLRQRNSG
ncbi:MAG: Rpn family recombination-promoting nuclease/putative transposase [Pirellulaceae bacterium]